MLFQDTSSAILVLLTCLTSIAIILVFDPVYFWLDHLDHPGGRKRHALGTPLSGGVSIALTALLFGLIAIRSSEFFGFAFGMVTLVGLGAIDDRQHVPAWIRLALQTAAVTIGMCGIAGARLETLGNVFGTGELKLGDWSVAFTVFASVGVINAVNMIDGVDGIAGSFSLLVLMVVWMLAAPTAGFDTGMIAVLIGSLLGFLAFNFRAPWRRKARVFLGDAGSLLLGYALVWFLVDASQDQNHVIQPVTAVWLLGLPLCDTAYLMIARGIRRQNPMTPDRYHYHHLLLRFGLSPAKSCIAWLTTSAFFMGIGISLEFSGLPSYWSMYLFLAAFVLYCLLVRRAWRWLLIGRRASARALS